MRLRRGSNVAARRFKAASQRSKVQCTCRCGLKLLCSVQKFKCCCAAFKHLKFEESLGDDHCDGACLCVDVSDQVVAGRHEHIASVGSFNIK